MEAKRKEEMIRRCAAKGKVRWSSHASREALAEQLMESAVVQALTRGEVIEDYPQLTRPLPDCLVLGWLADASPVHAVIGVDEPKDQILVITVYRPLKERWSDDYRTRKPGTN